VTDNAFGESSTSSASRLTCSNGTQRRRGCSRRRATPWRHGSGSGSQGGQDGRLPPLRAHPRMSLLSAAHGFRVLAAALILFDRGRRDQGLQLTSWQVRRSDRDRGLTLLVLCRGAEGLERACRLVARLCRDRDALRAREQLTTWRIPSFSNPRPFTSCSSPVAPPRAIRARDVA